MNNELEITNQRLIKRVNSIKKNLLKIIRTNQLNNPQKIMLIHLMNIEVPLTVKELSTHLNTSERQVRTNLKKLSEEKTIYEIVTNHGLKQYKFGKIEESKDLIK